MKTAIVSFLMSLAYRVRPSTSVASLTSGLQKTIIKLDAHATAQAKKLTALEDQIEAMNRQADDASKEIMQAANVRTNIARLVGQDSAQGSIL